MLQAFVFDEVAVLVRHWFEIDLADSHLEHGARVELRLLAGQPHRGTESASQQYVIDQPAWRADLFDRLDATAGGFDAAHFHPRFAGVEPSERHWANPVRESPWDWLGEQLSNVGRLVEAAGLALRRPGMDNVQVRVAAPQIVAAAQRLAPAECRSAQQCYALTRDAATSVDLMLGSLARPDLLDRDRVAPWARSRSAR
ncbi:hypothetical protein ACTXG6_09620 [Pseudonocardia sp. Cha107L01]|uniref:hypothetical protein n=1 Tax=Pseudonocardia sp. Cha107L01 TaxID=3457576 RepID=UPI00403ED062